MPRDGDQSGLSETAIRGWRDFGRHAARNKMDLKLVLTNNPVLDRYIQEGYDQGKAVRELPPPPVDPFAYDLLGAKVTPTVKRRR